MSYLHAGILGWLALAAAPFLLHWLLRERIRRLSFAGTRFLGAQSVTASARKRWLEVLVLVLRSIALIGLVLAFARPYLARSQGVHPLAVVLLDCSRPMQAGGRFERAREAALAVVRRLPVGESIVIAGLGSSEGRGFELASDRLDAERRIESLHPGGEPAALFTGIQQAIARCGAQPSAIHLISALPAQGFPLSGHLPPLPSSCRIEVHDIKDAHETATGTVQVSAELEGGELTPGDGNLLVAGRLTNHGAARSVTVTLKQGDRLLDSHACELPQDGEVALTLRGTLPEVGEFPCSVGVDDVPTVLPGDERCLLVAEVVRAEQVVIVDGQPSPDHSQDPAFFIAAALRAGDAKHYAISVGTTLRDLAAVASVVLACPQRCSSFDAEHLAAFVRAGGGLLIILGPGQQPAELNPLLAQVGPARLRAWNEQETSFSPDAAGMALVNRVVGEHAEELSQARFHGSWDLSDVAGNQVLLRFNDQRPALVATRVGLGESLLLATACDRRVNGDFPLRPLFLPLVHELMRTLHADAGARHGALTGADLASSASDTLSGEQGAVPRSQDGTLAVSLPGFYHLTHEGSTTLIAVNGDPKASDPVVLQAGDVERLITHADAGVQATSHGLERVLAGDEVRQAEAHLGLGRWCLLLVALLLLLELFMAQSVSRR